MSKQRKQQTVEINLEQLDHIAAMITALATIIDGQASHDLLESYSGLTPELIEKMYEGLYSLVPTSDTGDWYNEYFWREGIRRALENQKRLQ